MLLVREVFNTKPGKAGALVKMFKQVIPYMEKTGLKNTKVMTDHQLVLEKVFYKLQNLQS